MYALFKNKEHIYLFGKGYGV